MAVVVSIAYGHEAYPVKTVGAAQVPGITGEHSVGSYLAAVEKGCQLDGTWGRHRTAEPGFWDGDMGAAGDRP